MSSFPYAQLHNNKRLPMPPQNVSKTIKLEHAGVQSEDTRIRLVPPTVSSFPSRREVKTAGLHTKCRMCQCFDQEFLELQNLIDTKYLNLINNSHVISIYSIDELVGKLADCMKNAKKHREDHYINGSAQ